MGKGNVKQRRAAKGKGLPRGGYRANDAAPPPEKPVAAAKHNGSKHSPVNTATSSSHSCYASLLIYIVRAFFVTSLSFPFWILTGVLSFIYGRPPKMVHASQTWRYLRYATAGCKQDLSFSARIDLVITIIVHSATSSVSGFCWLIDEILYGRQMNSLSICEPFFVLSAYRSASTEMARTLAKDTKRFVAPNAIMCAFPYLWLWKIITWMVAEDSGITAQEANGYLNKNFTKESLERHDNDHFAIDTFDGYFLSSHLNGMAFQLGPRFIVRELNAARFKEYNRYLFEHSFVEHVDRIARKTLLFHNSTPHSSQNKTFLLKGHFLLSAPALQRRYPDARFLAVLRDPLDRLKSCINHMAVNATLWQGKLPHWDWLSEAYQQIELDYCQREIEWYNDGGNGKHKLRLAVKFDAFVKDFDKTMKKIYQDLLQEEQKVPNFEPRPKVSKRYVVNRSLKELGVDVVDLKWQLMGYYEWMKKQ